MSNSKNSRKTAQQPVVLIDNNISTLRPASSSKHTNKKPKVSSEPYTLQKLAQPTSTEINENIIKDAFALPPGTGDIADNSLTLDISSKNPQHQAETANASCSTTQSGGSASTDMKMDQPVDPASTSTQQQRTIPVVPVDPIPILPNLVIATPADTVKGKSASDKKTHIRRFFGTNGVATALVRNVAGKSYVCAYFSTQSDVDDALKRDTAPLTNSQKEGTSAPTFTLFTTIKPDKTDDEKTAAKACTIQVIDIPLYRKGADVRAVFSNFGTIVKISMVTKSLYQNAYIQFDSTAASIYFTENAWSHFIYEDAIRVLPLTLPKNKQETRQLHCFKLTGFPRNTNARDLVGYLKSINARSCFLPRNAKNYRTFNYAYVNFLTEEDMVKAAQTHHSYKGKPLFWTSLDAQCCNFCGNRQQNKKKSFADAVKGKHQDRTGNNNGNNRTPNPNLQNGTASVGSMHDNQLVDAQLHQVRQMMTELQSMFKGLQAEVTALNRKVDDRIKNKSVSHSPSVQKPIPSIPALITLQVPKQTAPVSQTLISVANSTSFPKCTHTDVESSSSGSDNDDIIKQQSEINSLMSLMSSKLDKFINYMGFGSSPDLIDGGDDNEEQEMDYDPSIYDNEASGNF
ncbi:hypothetical protein RhiirA4_428831 [Rhizophagus irregularis]|uniref:RRM domain-containing protein n=1 Tax=Rhizophagus irregularis TaxID=588596 RepID=A0A2I1HEF1_9GLOM|nr:hypothetical protein RhiirA4_428831 [Rhizophagus irregularis]